jgi:diadenosine tetraphosphate (Ap4A) HIT family hydrolase
MACNCEICAELAGLPSRFSSLYSGRLDSRAVGGSKNFVVLPSIGQLGDAHLMIVSRTHETALASLSRDLREELISLLTRTRRWLKAKLSGNDIVFENGDPKGFGLMSCSISHLHVHLVAYRHSAPNLARSIQQLGVEPVSTFDTVANITDSYSFVDMSQGGMHLIRRQLPSQTLRQIVAREIGMPKWDWREASTEDQLSSLALVARSDLALGNGAPPI